ncbi:MAG TPA: TonB-dependent receptor [Steroidobacteraceae bacterium]|nr:TonB-dependent receptor [Steroidobacteraceae bacterium]
MLTVRVFGARARVAAPLLCLATAALAQVAEQPGSGLPTIVVTAQHLNEERARIEPSTGASTYTFDAEAIQAAPGGDNVQLNQVMLQVPDAAQDSFGQLHIRGDHNGLQFRLNGVILPDGISFFGQTLPPRMISTFKLITGSLPSEYGLRSAGIIDLTTKSGALHPGGAVTLYGGSHGAIEPSVFYGGSSGSNTYFVTGDFIRNNLGIESPDGSSNPIHDHTRQIHGFGYFERLLDEGNRISLLWGSSDDRFQIPNRAGVAASQIGPPGLAVAGTVNNACQTGSAGVITDFLSNCLDENQREITHFGALSVQHSQDKLSVQGSLIARYSTLNFSPDPNLGDLLFNGISQQAYKRDVAYALQGDAAYKLNETHTLRAGVYAQTDRLTSNTTSQVLPAACTGSGTQQDPYVCSPYNGTVGDPLYNPLYAQPLTVIDDLSQTQWIESVYLQDEWLILPVLTVNYGVRFDHYSAFTSGSQVEPRVNFVWQPRSGTTLHAGYSRFFSPPPFELVGSTTISKFLNTTQISALAIADPVKAEKSNYYDVGLEQRVLTGLTLGVDSYYKQATDLIDEGQFGAPIILTPFNYRYGQVYGVEFTGSYNVSHFQAYGNLALQRAIGKHFESSQFNFSPSNLAYVADHYIHLDHEQEMTISGGAAYTWRGTRLSGDLLVGSGLRASLVLPDGSVIPNGAHLPYYRQVNLGVSHSFEKDGIQGLSARFDVINAFDQKYQIRNGTGVGVGAPQYGPRRGLFVGVTQAF